VPRESFRLVGGADRLTAYESSPGKLRRFCSGCGSHLFAERASDPYVILRVATLDDDPGTKPLVHIWRSHEVPWCAYEGDIKDFAEGVPAR
jgi:ADP-ribosyl-[dinitrogen reductase] hydrolase